MILEGLLCLTLNIFHESRGEPLEAQIGVAAVTVNRAMDKEYPSSICGVVYEPSAFSWTSSSSKRKIRHESQLKDIEERKAFIQAKQIASMYLQNKIKNPIGNRKFFNNVKLGKRHKTPNKPITLSSRLVYY